MFSLRLGASSLIILRQPDSGLDLRHGRKRLGQGGREGISNQHPIFRHTDRPADIAQGILHHDPVALAAEDQTDTRGVTGLPLRVIKSGEIEVHLASMLGLESADLEVDGDQAPEPAMVEE